MIIHFLTFQTISSEVGGVPKREMAHGEIHPLLGLPVLFYLTEQPQMQ
jgi:hypothetical protein